MADPCLHETNDPAVSKSLFALLLEERDKTRQEILFFVIVILWKYSCFIFSLFFILNYILYFLGKTMAGLQSSAVISGFTLMRRSMVRIRQETRQSSSFRNRYLAFLELAKDVRLSRSFSSVPVWHALDTNNLSYKCLYVMTGLSLRSSLFLYQTPSSLTCTTWYLPGVTFVAGELT